MLASHANMSASNTTAKMAEVCVTRADFLRALNGVLDVTFNGVSSQDNT